MKKIALISVLVTYLLLNIGVSMRLHYCGNAVSFIDFFPVSTKTCCGEEKKSCCSDKYAYIAPQANQDNTVVANFEFLDFAKFHLVAQDFSFLSKLVVQKTELNSFGFGREIFHYKVPLYLRNRVLLL